MRLSPPEIISPTILVLLQEIEDTAYFQKGTHLGSKIQVGQLYDESTHYKEPNTFYGIKKSLFIVITLVHDFLQKSWSK